MIDNQIIEGFGDELAKIAGLVGDAGKTMKKWVSTGWNKPAGLFEKAHQVEGVAKGKPMMEAGKQVWKERPDAGWMGQGNITKHLPIGDKSIFTGLTAMQAPAALRKEDETGMERSRTERLSGLAGGTVGSLAGMGALAHMPNPVQWMRGTSSGPMKGLGITRAIIGGLGGGILGERMATAPSRMLRKAEMPAQQAQVPQGASGGVA